MKSEKLNSKQRMDPVYCDNAATTPVDPRVFAAMRPYFLTKFGNPGSLHSFGQEAIGAVDAARETVAGLLGVGFRDVLFTGSATEANNIAIRGVLAAYRAKQATGGGVPRIIISAIEHESILETALALRTDGVDVVEIPVDERGVVSLEKIREALTPSTLLVSVMYANNEIGTVQPIQMISELVRAYRATTGNAYPFFHTDASQAFQFLDCSITATGVDMMTISSQKVYGPKGVGVLYCSNSVMLAPIVTGGGQEFGLRSGTENVPGIVGCAKALELAQDMRVKEGSRQRELAEYALLQCKKAFPKAQLNGMPFGKYAGERLPNILNIHFPGNSAADVIMQADLLGLAISAGSACTSRSHVPSYVLRALGYSVARASESVRISIGRFTTRKDIDVAVRILKKSVQ